MTENTINDAMTMRPGGGVSLGRVDQYELVRELGGGGFGVVYLALDTVSGVEVAVKGLPPIIRNSAEELERIRANFALVSRLHHPYIAAALVLHPAREVIYCDPSVRQKLRVDPGDTLMVMEYAPGVTLSQWRKQFPGGKVPFEVALQLSWQIAQALDYAHGQHIIHRDIKPSNVVVETQLNGEVTARLLDFGLAAEVRSSMGRVSREIHDTSGTRPYMAPEQWAGRKQGPATDQYALAVLLCELLTGEVPFASVFETGDPVVMMTAVCNREVELPADCPRQSALRRALSKDPAVRFSSCMEFIETAAESEQVQTQMTEPQPEVKPAAGRPARRKGTILVIGIALTVFSIGGGLWYQHKKNAVRLEHARIIAMQKANDERIAREKAEEERIAREEAERKVSEATKQFIEACDNSRYDDAARLRNMVDQGNATVQLDLGSMYADGRGVAKDEIEAVKWYRRAAEQGLAAAQYNLGGMYENGRGVAKDEVETVKWYRTAAEQNDADAQYKLGLMYDEGRGVPKDEREAVELYRTAAEQGLAAAQNNLGFMYEKGRGVPKDEREAVKLYRKAAEQGLAGAQCNLGSMHANGSGVAKDDAEAVKWFRKAAEQGLAAAQAWLGVMYEEGRGVPKDEREAVKLYRRAAEQGLAAAQNNLGFMYEKGRGVPKDEREAVELYRRAAEQGLAVAQCSLGFMYEEGRGVPKDEREAVKLYRRAAEQGLAAAQYNLGGMYENGRGVAKDEVETVKWYRRAAEQNDADAQYKLGLMYDEGRGVPKDEREAVKWYRKAAKQGIADAQNALRRRNIKW